MPKYKQTHHSLEHMSAQDEIMFNIILEDAGCTKRYTDSQGDGRTVFVCTEKPRDVRGCFIEWEEI